MGEEVFAVHPTDAMQAVRHDATIRYIAKEIPKRLIALPFPTARPDDHDRDARIRRTRGRLYFPYINVL